MTEEQNAIEQTTENVTFIGVKPEFNRDVFNVLIGEEQEIEGKLLLDGNNNTLRIKDIVMDIRIPGDNEFKNGDTIKLNQEGEIVGEVLVSRNKNALSDGNGCNAKYKFY